MSEENNHISFTASDIERYHKGLLSAGEMHTLEKAALEDPFLAEALEGYGAGKINVQGDIQLLKKRLDERVKGAKIIPLAEDSKNNDLWWRVAAIIILIGGAGFLVFKLTTGRRPANIAQADTKKKEAEKSTDTVGSISTTPGVGSTKDKESVITTHQDSAPQADIVRKKNIAPPATYKKEDLNSIKKDTSESNPLSTQNDGKAGIEAPITVRTEEEKKQPSKTPETLAGKTAGIKADDKKSKTADKAREDVNNGVVVNGYSSSNRNSINNNRLQNNGLDNLFRGRVTDANNNAVPFANINVTGDSTRTYADAQGYFSLVAPDTVMDVKIKSVGFENSNALLRNSITSNQVILQEDRKSLNEVVISKRSANADQRSAQPKVQDDASEPADGWANYDNYLLNNLEKPEEMQNKKEPGEVEISFDVNKKGYPVNIKVEKSLCEKCDKEAVRLIKQGPRWKRKSAKGRTSVTVSF